MRKSLSAFAAASVIMVAAVATLTTAGAQCCWSGPAGAYYPYLYDGFGYGYQPRFGGYGSDLAVAFGGYALAYPPYAYGYGYPSCYGYCSQPYSSPRRAYRRR
jgi:hypothetical protein